MEDLIYKAIVIQYDPLVTNIINLYSEKTNLITDLNELEKHALNEVFSSLEVE